METPDGVALAPLRAADGAQFPARAECRFTAASLHVRLPSIIRELLARNNGELSTASVAAISALREGLLRDDIVAVLPSGIAFCDETGDGEAGNDWARAIAPYAASAARWSALPWFLAETYTYALMNAVIRADRMAATFDVFLHQKTEALESGMGQFLGILAALGEADAVEGAAMPAAAPAAAAAAREQRLRATLACSLWGNKADLSLTGGKAYVASSGGSPVAASASRRADFLLVDDSAAAAALVLSITAASGGALGGEPAPAAAAAGADAEAIPAAAAVESDRSAAAASAASAAAAASLCSRREVEAAARASGAAAEASPALALITVLLDNCGLELLSDLLLVDALLASAPCRVLLLAKAAPVFVSDAMAKDVAAHLEALRRVGESGALRGSSLAGSLGESGAPGESGALAPSVATAAAARALHARLESAQRAGRLAVVEEAFLHGPRPFWEAPPRLAADLARARLLIVKGDANYRRLLGDRHWPRATPAAAALAYAPAPLLALRTLKAGVAVGIAPEVEAAACAAAADWLTSGEFGVIQLVQP